MSENDQQPFSEEAALRELEELQRAIEQSRVRRKDANDAFDQFLRSFDRVMSPPVARIEAEPPRVDPAPPQVDPPLPPVEAAPPRIAPAVPPVEAAPPRSEPAPSPVEAAPLPVLAEPPAAVEPPLSPPEPAVVAAAPAAVEDLTSPHPELEDTLIVAPVRSPLGSQPLTWPPSDLPPHPEDEMHPEVPDGDEPTAVGLKDPLQLDAWEHHTGPSAATSAFPAESDRQAMAEATLPRQTREVPAALRATAPRSSGRIPPVVGLLVVLVFGAAVFFVWRAMSRDTSVATDPGSTGSVVSQPQPAPGAAAPPVARPAPAAAAAPPAAEVLTVRKAWVRVLVDGQKVIERELPAGTRIPLTPTSQVVVRAGDAGAVRVTMAGKDQGPVGRDGEAATRAFAVTPTGVR